MGTGSDSSSVESLRRLAEAQDVSPSDEDLRAVLGFLTRILPALAELEKQLPPETRP
ncbi:MAG: hypothetical protein ACRDOF_05915 [Gaiellaceae bacterium]